MKQDMNRKAQSSACIVFILLGVAVSLCRGAEEQRISLHSMPSKDLDSVENEPLIYTSQVKKQNETELKNHSFLREDRREAKEGSTTEGETFSGQRQQTFSETEKGKMAPAQEGIQSEFSRVARSNTGEKEFFMSKRLSQMLQNSRGMDYISRPGFRSWGGKRTKFATWGGKRSRFSNWGGKRSPTVSNEDHPFSEEIDNGVHLMMNPLHLDYEDVLTKNGRSGWLKKKDKFKSWGGKRNSAITSSTMKMDDNAQTRFSNWKGKWIAAEDNSIEKMDPEHCESDDRDGIPEDELPKDASSNGEYRIWRDNRIKQDLGHPSDSASGKYKTWQARTSSSSRMGKKSFDSEIPVKRSNDTSMKQFLTMFFRSKQPAFAENSVLDWRSVLGGKSLYDSEGITKNSFSSWKGKR